MRISRNKIKKKSMCSHMRKRTNVWNIKTKKNSEIIVVFLISFSYCEIRAGLSNR